MARDDVTHEDETREAKARPRSKRGTGFPVVSLAEASKVLKEAGKYGFEHSVAAFAKYMGHSTTNSGAFRQRLAAFRDWKLIAGRGESVSMTEIARVIALPPDDDAERRALQTAFGNCVVFFRLYEGSQKNVPLGRDGLGNRAVHDFGVSPSSVNKFVESFVDSAVTAGLAEVFDDGQVALLDPTQPDQPALAQSQPSSSNLAPLARATGSARITEPVVHQAWQIDGGTVLFEIRSAKPLPASAYATVGEVVASLERLAESLAPATGGSADDATESTE